jgi:hypothetical protein
MTAVEEIRTVAMTADQTIGISAGRAMVIETKTAPNNNRVRVAIEIILTVDLSNKDLADHSNNRGKDLHRKIVDLGKDKDLVDRNKVRVKGLVDHNKTVDHSNNRDPADHNKIEDLSNKDLVDQDLLRDQILINQIHHKLLHRPHRLLKDKQ